MYNIICIYICTLYVYGQKDTYIIQNNPQLINNNCIILLIYHHLLAIYIIAINNLLERSVTF